MNALDLSEQFFRETALPSLKQAFPLEWQRMGAGLVGNGSDCFGFDDEISRDHDWGVEFFVWLADSDYETYADEVRVWKRELWESCPGVPFRQVSDYGIHDTVTTPSRFYRMLTGFPQGPRSVLDWRRVPETNLAMAVNGRVFLDPLGEFSLTRRHLMEYYPEDLRRKKIAARCLSAAQTGQYNFLRCAQRGDVVAKEVALARFAQDAMQLVFLLNRRYMPYYKWSYRAMRDLPLLAAGVAPELERLWAEEVEEGELDPGTRLLREVSPRDRGRAVVVERICALIIGELRRQGLSGSTSTFLVEHGEAVQATITDPDLARIPTQYE